MTFCESLVRGMCDLDGPLMYRFLAEHGMEMGITSILLTASKPLGQCFQNSARNRTAGDLYCEGLAKPKNLIPMTHAWNACKRKPGKFYDSTWEIGGEYFGVLFDSDFVGQNEHRTGYYGIFEGLYLLKMSASDCLAYLENGLHKTHKELKLGAEKSGQSLVRADTGGPLA